MAAAPRMIFVNLAVKGLEASMRFFAALGFRFDPRITDDTAAGMVVNESAFVMLLRRERFAEFTPKPLADPATRTEAILAVSAESRAAVDAFADAALAVGATPANDPMDHGVMYGRSFSDLDGHLWEVVWMDPAALGDAPA